MREIKEPAWLEQNACSLTIGLIVLAAMIMLFAGLIGLYWLYGSLPEQYAPRLRSSHRR